jgi:uncharacterized coiled-coil protein SlyX
MAQIIKHRRGSLESLSAVTSSLQKGEIVIASGSSVLSATNGTSIAFVVPADGQVQAINRVLTGTADPAAVSNTMTNGVPFYDSVSGSLWLLNNGGNTKVNLIGNIQSFSTSVDSRLDAVEAATGGGGDMGQSITQLNAFTSSQETKNSTLATYTASVNNSITSLNSSTASQQSSIDQLNTASGSAIGRLSNLEATSASVNSSVSNLNANTASQQSSIDQLNTASGSSIIRLNNLESFSGSQINKDSTLATYTASVDVHISNVNSYTSSLQAALTASGVNLTANGNLTVAGNFTVNGTTTAVNSTTIQLGDNIIELNGTGVANGGLLVKDPTAPNTVSGSLLWDSTNDYWKAGALGAEEKLLRAGSDGIISSSAQVVDILSSLNAFTSSASTRLTNLETTSASVNSSLSNLNTETASIEGRFTTLASVTSSYNSFTSSAGIRLTNLETTSASVNSSISALNLSTASQQSSIDQLNTASGSATGRLSNLEATSASVNSSVSNLNANTASQQSSIDQLNTVSGSSIIRLNNLEAFSGSQINKDSTLATYTGSVDVHISNVNSYTASATIRLNNIESFTSSFGTTFSSSVDSRLDTLEGTGTIQGVGTTNNVNFASVSTTGNVTVGGDLVVQGNTVSLNVATLTIEDKLITLASGSTDAATANGAGIEVAGANATITYVSAIDSWALNKPLSGSAVTSSINIPSGGGNSKRLAFRGTTDNIEFVAAATTVGDTVQWDGTNFVMSNVIDGGSF